MPINPCRTRNFSCSVLGYNYMRNTTVQVRIAVGFGAVILLSAIVGVISIIRMQSSCNDSKLIANYCVPLLKSANELEAAQFGAGYQMVAYSLNLQDDWLAKGRDCLKEIRDSAATLKRIGETMGPEAQPVRQAMPRLDTAISDYAKVIDQTELSVRKFRQVRELAATHAQALNRGLKEYIKGEETALAGKAGTGQLTDEIAAQNKNLADMNRILAASLELDRDFWRVQAMSDSKGAVACVATLTNLVAELETVRASKSKTADVELVNRIVGSASKLRGSFEEFINATIESEKVRGERLKAYRAALAEARALAEVAQKAARDYSDRSRNGMDFTSKLNGWGLAGGLLVGVGLAAFIARSLNRSLRRVAEHTGAGAEQTLVAASQVAGSSLSLAKGANEQNASLDETRCSLEEMASITRRNSENANKANDLARETRAAADKGASDMEAMSAAMEAIKTSSDDVAKVIKAIDQIAFQTNILALNAAVEAARAGEAGMGFAVVADEVRSLAQRSAEAAKETAAMIEGAIGKSRQGVEISDKVVATLNNIVAKVRQLDELIAEVAGASNEQTQGITRINNAVGNMDRVAKGNAASAQESASAAEELTAQAMAMTESVKELLQLVGGATGTSASSTVKPESVQTPGSRSTAAASAKGRAHTRVARKPAPEGALAV